MHLAWRFLLNLLDEFWLASVLLTAFAQFLHHSPYLGVGASFFSPHHHLYPQIDGGVFFFKGGVHFLG